MYSHAVNETRKIIGMHGHEGIDIIIVNNSQAQARGKSSDPCRELDHFQRLNSTGNDFSSWFL